MNRFTRPLESLRCGGLPNGWQEDPGDDEGPVIHARNPDGSARLSALGGGMYFGPPGHGIRRCPCGLEVELNSRADREHRAGCGDPEKVPERTITTKEIT